MCIRDSNLLAQINPEVVHERKLSGRFWEQYLKPSISRFREKLSALEPLEQAYFYTPVSYTHLSKERLKSFIPMNIISLMQ